MIFGVFILVLIGAIAYFHYVQGFFSATLSAVIAVISALMAISFHEIAVDALLGGKMAEEAHAMMLVVIFAVTYIVLRVIFDMAIPGGMQFPAIVDKVGGAAMGVIVGVFATGIVALAAQAMPFGPSILGYSLFDLNDTRDEITVIPSDTGRPRETYVADELAVDQFDPRERNSMMIPADNIVLALAEFQSQRGALSGSKPLSAIHPDYPLEMFGTRLGVQAGGKKVALDNANRNSLKSVQPFLAGPMPAIDHELDTIRKVPSQQSMSPAGDEYFIVVRATISRDAADSDSMVRFSPANFRLVTSGDGKTINYFPFGTVEDGRLIYLHKPDDFLFLDVSRTDKAVDLIFRVKRDHLTAAPGADKKQVVALPEGAFVEFKRMARESVAGPVKMTYSGAPEVAVLRKTVVARNRAQPIIGGAATRPAIEK